MNDNNNVQSAAAGRSAESLSKELYFFCKSEALSEEVLHEIIGRYGLTPNCDARAHVDNYNFFHWVCCNERLTEGITRCLIEYFPDAASATDKDGRSSLHCVFMNKSATLNIIRLLIDAAPETVRSVSNDGMMPLHKLCGNRKVDEAAAVPILKLLVEKYPEAARHADDQGVLPIHWASGWRSPEFCRLLIEAYPGSEQIGRGSGGQLPLHIACVKGSLATVKLLYRQHPNAINHTASRGHYPIHAAISGIKHRDNPAAAVEIVQFLLDCDPDQKLQKYKGKSLLHYTCLREFNDSNIEAGIQLIKIIFDVQPDAIEHDIIVSDIYRYHQRVQAFINGELVFARQAKDLRMMNTPDDNGQLPLHTALQNNVRLGSIKLLVKGNPSALRTLENNFALPLHIACQHHDSASVVRYLLSIDEAALEIVDKYGNTVLHYACRGAKYDTIAMLLEKYDAASVSKRNAHGKLPINLLWESNEGIDRESVEYTDSIFQLLRAYPEMVAISNSMVNRPVDADTSLNGKKRKLSAI